MLHPLEAFKDEEFLERVRTDAEELKGLVARELRRKICGGGAAASGEGVNWGAEVRVGVHAGPSMNHLHVHVISREGFSDRVKKRVHYNSFNTAFFVPLDELPLRTDDPRWEHHERARLLKMDYTCWRCGRGFKNSFAGIKQHVAEEFVEWKKALVEAGGGGDGRATSSFDASSSSG
ncbi:HIT-like protein [Tuber magnatum]|uniref:HIT-like protein n=1 Tax=Tuber magnatum TaxID=42249 RepID=A0A317SYW7_9PEZI|nr:HIT-like protein [Tuber magnatum]